MKSSPPKQKLIGDESWGTMKLACLNSDRVQTQKVIVLPGARLPMLLSKKPVSSIHMDPCTTIPLPCASIFSVFDLVQVIQWITPTKLKGMLRGHIFIMVEAWGTVSCHVCEGSFIAYV